MKRTILTALAVAAAAMPALGVAQVNPAFSDITEATEQARSLMQTERKMVLSQALELTADESNAFWPLYDKYAAELKQAGDLRVKVITDYAASYDKLTDATAKTLISDYLKYQEKILKIRKGYVKKFEKVLSPVKVARFYQVENKLDSITNFALAREIPLVPAPAAPAPLPPPG